MKNSRNKFNILLLAAFLIQVTFILAPLRVDAQHTILNNNKLRMGNGSENSVNTSGNLQQPFYYNSVQAAWRKLTYSVYPLDNAFAVDGAGTGEWNLNGTIVQNPTLSNQTVNTSGFVYTSGSNGYGTIVSKGTITVGSTPLEIENTYTLPQNSAYIEVKVKVRNIGSAPVQNVRIWIGTRDDWVGATDSPTKQKGNLVNGEFSKITNATTRAAAIKIFTSSEGVLFYTNSTRGNTIVNNCCSWTNVINQNPQTSTTEVTNDGSYGFYVRLNDLAVGASDDFTWYYAAGELAALNEIIREVASVSGSISNITSNSATFDATSSANATGYWMVVPRNSAAPTAAQIKAGANYGSVVVTARGSGAMTANTERTFNLTGLSPSTNYDFYFVSEDATPQYSDIFSAQFTTHALPTISNITNQTTCQDLSTTSGSFTVGDAETAAASLTLSASSSNTALVPNANITLGGSGANRTVSVTPAAGQYGTATITVTVRDGDGDTASKTFTVNVSQNNTPSPEVSNTSYYIYATASNISAQATGANLLWYNVASGGTGSSTAPTPSTSAVGTQDFWVTQTIDVCQSPRAKITVTIMPTAISGSVESKTAFYPLTTVIDNTLTISGSNQIPNGSVSVGTGFQSGDELICTATLPGGVSKSYNASTGVLTFTGTTSAAEWQTILRNVRFRTTSVNTANRSINFTLSGGGSYTRTLQYNSNAVLSLNNSVVNEGLPAGSSIGSFSMTGAEAGLTFTYQLVGGAGSTDNASFMIENGVIKTAAVLDYESQQSYSVRVQVADNYDGKYQQIFIISLNNLNDTKPVIAKGQVFSVDENSAANTVVGTLQATDADGITTFGNWTIVGGNTNNAFAIDAASGEIHVVDPLALDYEVNSSFTLTVTVDDAVNTSETESVVINLNNLNDTKPVITASQNFNVNENNAAGTVINTVVASDADGVTTYSDWTIVSGNTGNAFTINASTGEISVADETAIDYETRTTFTLKASVSDGANTSETEEVIITLNNINDNKPAITTSQSFDVDENSAADTSVGTVAATDADGITTYSEWTIVDGNTGDAFAINSSTGELTVANASAIDYEVLTNYTLVLSVYDGVNTSETETVVVNVKNLNDNKPVITASQTFAVNENCVTGTTVNTVAVTDADGITTYSDWTIVNGNTDNAFAINASTGEITVADASVIDYETITSFTLVLSVYDGENTSETETVVIALNNLNDTKPVVTALQHFSIDENSAGGTSIGTLLATDADGVTTYNNWTMVSGNTGDAFAIDSSTGEITVADASAIDYEVLTTYILVVSVFDGENTSETEEVVIDLNNLNDTKPVIAAGQYFSIDENSAIGTAVGIVTATDIDGNTIYSDWTIISGNTGGAFSIDPLTGEIKVANSSVLNYEVLTGFRIIVSVSDGVNTSEGVEVKIELNNLNDTPPVMVVGQVLQVKENSSNGTKLGGLAITDADGTTTYSSWTITGGNTNNAFSIDPVTGQIIVSNNAAFDFEGTKTFTLTVTVSDGVHTIEQVFVITVQNENDNAPTDILLSNATFKESILTGTEVGSLSTLDLDGEDYHTYTLVSGEGDTDNYKFVIEGDRLIATGEFNFDFEKMLTIRVRTTDNGGEFYEKSFAIIVEADTELQLEIPTAFSPNGDQVNDTWEIDRLLSYPQSKVRVFNSDGMEVFTNTGYTTQWDGTYKGKELAFGTYYYIISLNDAAGKVFRGTVMIIK